MTVPPVIDLDHVDQMLHDDRDAIREEADHAQSYRDDAWQMHPSTGPCGVCDTNPNTTEGPSIECPVHGKQPTWAGYDGLSWGAQQAIHHQTDAVTADALVAHARTRQWQEESVYTAEVIRRVMSHGDVAADWDSWDAYHAWYLSCGDVPDHGTSRWPVIECPPSGLAAGLDYLADGWHRLHSYVAAGDAVIPVLRSRPAPGSDPSAP